MTVIGVENKNEIRGDKWQSNTNVTRNHYNSKTVYGMSVSEISATAYFMAGFFYLCFTINLG